MPWNEPGSGNNDPWGNGNRNRGGQSPDLEDVINNVRKRVNLEFTAQIF